MINIKGLDKAELLVELYNHSHQQGSVPQTRLEL